LFILTSLNYKATVVPVKNDKDLHSLRTNSNYSAARNDRVSSGSTKKISAIPIPPQRAKDKYSSPTLSTIENTKYATKNWATLFTPVCNVNISVRIGALNMAFVNACMAKTIASELSTRITVAFFGFIEGLSSERIIRRYISALAMAVNPLVMSL
jgi:hypothetical protein